MKEKVWQNPELTSVSQCLQVYFDAALLTPAVSLAWDASVESLISITT